MFVVSIIKPGGVASGTIEYDLVWDSSGIEMGDDGSWAVTTDLGYRVTITDGLLTTFSASLVPCPHFHGVFDRLFGMLSLPAAWAGHSSAPDPALAGGPVEQSLTDRGVTRLGTVAVHEPSYCEGFTNWGSGATPETEALGTARPTLSLSGTWASSEGAVERPFTVDTTTGWGTTAPLVDRAGDSVFAELSSDPITISITRDLATAFDGIDFGTVDDATIATSFLRNLAADTTFVVDSGLTHAA
jgi:hypothetical protein